MLLTAVVGTGSDGAAYQKAMAASRAKKPALKTLFLRQQVFLRQEASFSLGLLQVSGSGGGGPPPRFSVLLLEVAEGCGVGGTTRSSRREEEMISEPAGAQAATQALQLGQASVPHLQVANSSLQVVGEL